MKILYMRLQASKILLILLFFNISLCIATRTKLVPTRPDKKGIQISEASCKGRVYKSAEIYNVVCDALLDYYALKKSGVSLRNRRYFVKVREEMPFAGPFYFKQFHSPTPHKDNYRDFVVFTMKGELAKVISGNRSNPGSPWRFEDCQLKHLMMPEKGDHGGNQSICKARTGGFRKDLIIIDDNDNDLGMEKHLKPENWSLALNP